MVHGHTDRHAIFINDKAVRGDRAKLKAVFHPGDGFAHAIQHHHPGSVGLGVMDQ